MIYYQIPDSTRHKQAVIKLLSRKQFQLASHQIFFNSDNLKIATAFNFTSDFEPSYWWGNQRKYEWYLNQVFVFHCLNKRERDEELSQLFRWSQILLFLDRDSSVPCFKPFQCDCFMWGHKIVFDHLEKKKKVKKWLIPQQDFLFYFVFSLFFLTLEMNRERQIYQFSNSLSAILKLIMSTPTALFSVSADFPPLFDCCH